jgi:hypothetical protein
VSEDESEHGRHLHDKHDKKKKQREKNRRDNIIFQQAELLRDNVDIGTPLTREKPPEKTATEPGADKWSSKLTSIRNRLDNSRRVSEDRWNRFAGTSDGGGRGR